MEAKEGKAAAVSRGQRISDAGGYSPSWAELHLLSHRLAAHRRPSVAKAGLVQGTRDPGVTSSLAACPHSLADLACPPSPTRRHGDTSRLRLRHRHGHAVPRGGSARLV